MKNSIFAVMDNKGKILITGGAGYIGSHTIIDLIEGGMDRIISVDDYSNSSSKTFDRIEKITGKRIQNIEIDLCDISKLREVFKNHKIDGIIHFAASKAVGESVELPLKYYRNNLNSVMNLLECCDTFGVNQFIFSSSCTVYGQPESFPVDENTPIIPAESPYGNTKQIAEEIIQDFAKVHPEFKATLLRYFNPVGGHASGLNGELPKGVPNNLVPFITQTAIGKREKLTVFGEDYDTRDGSCVRDYIHVMDISHAHTLAIQKMGDANSQIKIYNLGTGNGVSVLEVIQAFEKVSGEKLNYEIGPRREGDIAQIFSNSEKAYSELGWKIENGLEDMMLSAWQWEKNLFSESKS